MTDFPIEGIIILIIFLIACFSGGSSAPSKRNTRGYGYGNNHDTIKTVHLWYGVDDNGNQYIDMRKFIIYAPLEKAPAEWRQSEVFYAIAPVIKRNGEHLAVKFRARLCENDTLYFLTQEEYNRVCRFGRILGMVMPLPDYHKMKTELKYKYDLAEESKFKRFGYNVSAKDGFTAEYRQKVLMFMIESGLTNKYEAMNFLDFNISYHAHNPNDRIAVSKWEADRLFVSYYEYDADSINWVTTSNPPSVEAVRVPLKQTSDVHGQPEQDRTRKKQQTVSNVNPNRKIENSSNGINKAMSTKDFRHSYRIGQLVEHKSLGRGTIIDIDDTKGFITIRFEDELQPRRFRVDLVKPYLH